MHARPLRFRDFQHRELQNVVPQRCGRLFAADLSRQLHKNLAQATLSTNRLVPCLFLLRFAFALDHQAAWLNADLDFLLAKAGHFGLDLLSLLSG